MREIRKLNISEIEMLSKEDKIKYFEELKKYYQDLKINSNTNRYIKNIIKNIVSKVRNYDFEIVGTENIPKDNRGLFLVNHSNSHDFFSMQETFTKELDIDFVFLASNEGLNKVIISIFKSTGGVLMNRSDKTSIDIALNEFIFQMLNGRFGIIYPESTWNLHPYKPMLKIKTGPVFMSAITGHPIIPTIYEYVENSKFCEKEKDIYKKCIVKIEEPIYIDKTKSIIKQTNEIQKIIEEKRVALWKHINIERKSIEDVNKTIYLNHTYLKKFDGAWYFDSLRENKYIFGNNSFDLENEYHLDENGCFVPGILTEIEGRKYVKRF